MRNQYVFVLGLLTAFFVYAAYSFVFGTSEAADIVGHAPAATRQAPLPTVKDTLKATEGFVPVETLTLSKSNTVSFRNIVSAPTVAQVQLELLKKDKALPKGQPIYLVLDTPGGDIEAGAMLEDTARGLSRPVHTITNFAASMGFNIVQRLGKRYIAPSGVLMAHRARVEGVSGQIPGEFLTAVGNIYREVTRMEMQNASRLGISFEAYTNMVKDEKWYENGDEAVTQGAADAVANIRCDSSLDGTTTEEVATMFGPAKVTYADCPAVSSPLKIDFPGLDLTINKEAKRYRDNYRLFRTALVTN